MKKKDKDYTIIIGCGRLGSTIANTLSDKKKNVMVVDGDEDSLRKLSLSFAGQTYIGDASDYSVLEEVNIEKANVVIVVTHSDNLNIMLAQIVKEIYGVDRVIGRLYDPERDIVYKELGIETIYPAYLESEHLMDWYNKVEVEEDEKE